MTVLAAFIARRSRRAYLGADNLALPGRTRIDKICLLHDRFAVGCYGSSVAYDAICYLKSFDAGVELVDGTRFHAPTTLCEFLERLGRILPSLAKQKHALLEEYRKMRPARDRTQVEPEAPRSTLVILDTKALEIFEVVVEPLVPPQDTYSLAPTRLADDCWHTWPPALLPNQNLDLRAARDGLSAAINGAIAQHGPYYGFPGAEVRVASGAVTFRTSHDSLEGYVDQDLLRPRALEEQ